MYMYVCMYVCMYNIFIYIYVCVCVCVKSLSLHKIIMRMDSKYGAWAVPGPSQNYHLDRLLCVIVILSSLFIIVICVDYCEIMSLLLCGTGGESWKRAHASGQFLDGGMRLSPAHFRAHIASVAAVISCQSPSLLPHSSGRNILSLSHPSLTAGYWRSSHAHDTALLSPSSRFRRALVLAPSSSPDDSRTPRWASAQPISLIPQSSPVGALRASVRHDQLCGWLSAAFSLQSGLSELGQPGLWASPGAQLFPFPATSRSLFGILIPLLQHHTHLATPMHHRLYRPHTHTHI